MPPYRNGRNIPPAPPSVLAPSGRVFVIGAVAVVALLVAYTIYESGSSPGSVTSPVPSRFSANGRTFTFTYVATTQQERTSGLMNVKVTDSTTMLFAFPYSSAWTFWMYDTNTSLDMIWVNATGDYGQVVHVESGAPPCFNAYGYGCPTYAPGEPANYVIEAKAGFAASNGITAGTAVLFG